jgi:endonuclease YncB( thermonuclease family)
MFEGWMDIIMDTDHSQRDAIGISWDGIKIGQDLVGTYQTLAYRKEPDDLIGKIFYWAGTISQLVIGLITQPFGIAAFLVEESAQSIGMGAYFLYGAKDWKALSEFMPTWGTTLESYEQIARSFATLNPIGAGAVVIYLQAAKQSRAMMGQSMHTQLVRDARSLGIENPQQKDARDLIALIEIAESDRATKEIEEQNTFGTLAVKSTPTYADIYLDGASTGFQTPETFKNLEAGLHEVAVGKYNTKTTEYDTYATTIEITAGRKKEITLHLVGGTADDLINPGDETEDETPQLPPFIKTTVTCVKMIDGDTFETATGEKIRILGMDAPETGQPIADESKDFMAGKLLDHKVDIKIQTHLPVDTYGRTLAVVTYRDENVAVSSIANGLAKALIFDDATYDPTRYTEAEKLAKTRQLGIWNPATPGITWRGS